MTTDALLARLLMPHDFYTLLLRRLPFIAIFVMTRVRRSSNDAVRYFAGGIISGRREDTTLAQQALREPRAGVDDSSRCARPHRRAPPRGTTLGAACILDVPRRQCTKPDASFILRDAPRR